MSTRGTTSSARRRVRQDPEQDSVPATTARGLAPQSPQYETAPGRPHPLGATIHSSGVNFAFFSQHATSVELLLFDEHDDPEPVQRIMLYPERNKTFHFWHVDVKGLPAGTHYAIRVDGPWDLSKGYRFNRNKVLIDPYAKGNTNNLWDRVAACGPDDNLAKSLRSVVIDPSQYDWEGDKPLRRPMCETIVRALGLLSSSSPSQSYCDGSITTLFIAAAALSPAHIARSRS